MNNLSPIVLFAYNRPWHVEQTLVALMNNELADQSTLYIYCDGPKPEATEKQKKQIDEVRRIIRTNQWCKTIYIIESDINKGLGTSIIDGVSEVINKYGKVIVLEDDLVTSPLFLDYMNKALNYYEQRKSVFSISALSRPNPYNFYPKDYDYDVYVSLAHHPTGWGTWSDRWMNVDWEAKHFVELQSNINIRNAFSRGGDDWFKELEAQQKQELNVWSVRFALAHFVNHAVSICPIVSYVNHIGWDDSGTNATGSSRWEHKYLATKKDINFLDILYEDSRIINSWYSFSITKRRSLLGRIINRLGYIILKKDEFVLKGKVYNY